jgi:hypothetical protein
VQKKNTVKRARPIIHKNVKSLNLSYSYFGNPLQRVAFVMGKRGAEKGKLGGKAQIH